MIIGADTAFTVKACVTLKPAASVAVTLTSPAAVSALALPDITPSTKVNPSGKSPAIVYVKLSFASTSLNAVVVSKLNAWSTTAVWSAILVAVGASLTSVILTVMASVDVFPALSSRLKATVNSVSSVSKS